MCKYSSPPTKMSFLIRIIFLHLSIFGRVWGRSVDNPGNELPRFHTTFDDAYVQVDLSVVPTEWKDKGFGVPAASLDGSVEIDLKDQDPSSPTLVTRQDLQKQQEYVQRLQAQLQQGPPNPAQFGLQPQQQASLRQPPPPLQQQGGPQLLPQQQVQKQQQYIQKLQSQLQQAQKPLPNPIQVSQQQTHQVGPALQQEYLTVISQQRDYHKKLLQFQLVQKEAELYHQYQLKLAELRYHYQQLGQQVTASKPGVGPGGPPPAGPPDGGPDEQDTDDDL